MLILYYVYNTINIKHKKDNNFKFKCTVMNLNG